MQHVYDKKTMLRGVLVGASLAFTITAGSTLRFDSTRMRVDFQPRNEAFSIWALIYTTLGVSTIALTVYTYPQLSTSHTRLDLFALLTATSLVCAGAWALLVRQRKVAAAVAICSAAAAALGATATLHPPLHLNDWLISIGPGLLSGWLSLAAVLGIALADDRASPWLLVPAATAAAVAGAASGNPAPSLALLWGAAFTERTPPVLCVAALAVIGLGASVARVTMFDTRL